MNKYVAITIDVEPDCSPSWRYASPIRFSGVSKGIAEILQPLFNKYDMAPTYLVNNVVLEDSSSCGVLKKLNGRFELGTHLHPEFIEPEKTEFDYAGKKGEANCCSYAPDIEFEKLRSITNLFQKHFEFSPTSFRAGRFSAGPNTIRSLEKLGYKTDSSVTPHINWNDKTREKPVDYTTAKEQPYFIKSGSLLQEDASASILEVPVSIMVRNTSFISEAKRTYLGLKGKIKSQRPVWLRPVFSNLADFISITEKFEETYNTKQIIVYNLMFHNVEILPGLSPYTKRQSDCKAYLHQLEQYFIYCSKNKIQGITLSDAFGLYR